MTDTTQPTRIDEAEVATLASTRMRVTLFGAGKTQYARADQPALQVLLQVRNLYEATMDRIQKDQAQPGDLDRAERLIGKMWTIIHNCMIETNKAIVNHTKLAQADRTITIRAAPAEQRSAEAEAARKLPPIVANPHYHDLSATNG